MKKIISLLVFVLVLVLVLGGCCNTVWVRERIKKEGDADTFKQIGGIPFYVKKEVMNQTTSYSQTWLVATLTVEKFLVTNKEDKYESFSIDKQSFQKHLLKSQLSELSSIKERILQAGMLSGDDVNGIISSFAKINNANDISAITPERIENTMESTWIVNEKEKYYLNAPLPWFGSGNLTQELNSDGTLAKVTSNPETKLAEGISSIIPLKEYLTGKFVDSLKDDTDEKAMEELAIEESLSPLLATMPIEKLKLESELVYKVTLATDESGYIYKFTKQYEDNPGEIKPLPFNITNQIYTRAIIGGSDNSSPKKEDGKSVGLTGTISFPKDW